MKKIQQSINSIGYKINCAILGFFIGLVYLQLKSLITTEAIVQIHSTLQFLGNTIVAIVMIMVINSNYEKIKKGDPTTIIFVGVYGFVAYQFVRIFLKAAFNIL